MAVVVDASAIAAIAFGEPAGPTLAAHLQGETMLAPTLLDASYLWLAQSRDAELVTLDVELQRLTTEAE